MQKLVNIIINTFKISMSKTVIGPPRPKRLDRFSPLENEEEKKQRLSMASEGRNQV